MRRNAFARVRREEQQATVRGAMLPEEQGAGGADAESYRSAGTVEVASGKLILYGLTDITRIDEPFYAA